MPVWAQAAPLLIQVLDNSLEKSQEDDPSFGASVTYDGDLDEAPGSRLTQCWFVAGNRGVTKGMKIFLCLTLYNSFKISNFFKEQKYMYYELILFKCAYSKN